MQKGSSGSEGRHRRQLVRTHSHVNRTFSPSRESWAGSLCLLWFHILFIQLLVLTLCTPSYLWLYFGFLCLSSRRQDINLANMPIPLGLTVLFLIGKTDIDTGVLRTWLTQSSPERYAPPTHTRVVPRSRWQGVSHWGQPQTGAPTTKAALRVPWGIACPPPSPGKIPTCCLCPNLKWRPGEVTCLLKAATPS